MLQSWDMPLSDVELKEMKPMISQIVVLQAKEGKELSGVELITHFICLCIQPLQARAS
jgi:hypothetical protein